MLKFEKTTVYNFEDAFYGMRNAMESWDQTAMYMETCLFSVRKTRSSRRT